MKLWELKADYGYLYSVENNPAELIQIRKIAGNEFKETVDQVAVEEPLEIQLAFSTANGRMQKIISVIMRTPGSDQELATGFLFTEGILREASAINTIKHLSADENRILVTLHENIVPVLNSTERNFYISSSCGICGKASISAIQTISPYVMSKDNLCIPGGIFYGLQDTLRKKQAVFNQTGGLHASALFSLQGELLMLREDVGRHNALDKVIGAAIAKNLLPLTNYILFLSGRASFELVQKAVMAGIKTISAVGAPSSLAIELAKEAGLTLIGFLRGSGFNIYSGYQRVQP